MRTLLAARMGERQHPSVQLAVVADLDAAVAIETVHVNAELRDDLDSRCAARFAGRTPFPETASASRSAMRAIASSGSAVSAPAGAALRYAAP